MPLPPRIHTAACAHAWGGACARCAEACPSGALRLDDVPIVDPARCRGCGACAAACPTGAIAPAEETVPAALRRVSQRPDGPAILYCPHAGTAPEGSVPVHACLSGIDLTGLLSLAARGTDVVLIRGDCSQCSTGDGGVAFRRTLQSARALLNAANTPPGDGSIRVAVIPRPTRGKQDTSHPENFSRRELFERVRRKLSPVREEGPGLPPDRPRPKPATRRATLAGLLREWGVTGDPPEGLPAADLTLQGRCDGCGACSRVCPTAALSLRSTETDCRLTFDAAMCVDCGLCLRVCVPGSLRRAPAALEIFTRDEPTTLFRGEMRPCKRCRTLTADLTEDGYCRFCARTLRRLGGE